jgi:hypothetical protein
VSTTVSSSLSFDETNQELWLGSQFVGKSFSAELAPDGLIADATFWSCPIPPTQNACLLPTSADATLVTCDGAPVVVPSAAGCFERFGGGLRVVLSGVPGAYDAMVSAGGNPASAWEVVESAGLVTLNSPTDEQYIQLGIGSTGRLRASATVSPELSADGTSTRARFVACP